jgi:hypothetical protein
MARTPGQEAIEAKGFSENAEICPWRREKKHYLIRPGLNPSGELSVSAKQDSKKKKPKFQTDDATRTGHVPPLLHHPTKFTVLLSTVEESIDWVPCFLQYGLSN